MHKLNYTYYKMRKIMNWVLAAALIISGTSVMTSCSKDKKDDPVQEPVIDSRTEFVEHARASIKDLAENLNFNSWIAANQTNMLFNMYVLNNPNFEKTLVMAFLQKIFATIKPVEEDSELEQMGFQAYGTVDLTEIKHRLVMKTDGPGFDVEEADDFEIIVNGIDPKTQTVIPGSGKVVLKMGGKQRYKTIIAPKQMEGLAIVVILPSEFQYIMSNNLTGKWIDMYSANVKCQIKPKEGSEYIKNSENWQVSGTVNSNIGYNMPGQNIDKTSLSFSVIADMKNKKGGADLKWKQNEREMLALSIKESGDEASNPFELDLSQFANASSLFDVLATLWTRRSVDEAKLTLLDDLTTTLSVSDMAEALRVQHANSLARRNYADQKTIEEYAQQLNELVKAEITCKGVNQTIPMRMMATQYGVDWWVLPGFKFADNEDYVSFVDLLDNESVSYGVNIIDHAIEPMKQSVIVVRQLVQYVLGLVRGFQKTETE